MRFSGPPGPTVDVPAPVLALARGRDILPVWQNEAGGLTFRIGDTGAGAGTGERVYVKWAPAGSGLDLPAEAERLRWAGKFVVVPRVLDHGAVDGGTGRAGSWLVTAELAGESAVAPRWRAEPATAVRAMGEGLRALHEQLPREDCPFSWSVERRLARADGAGIPVPVGLTEPPPVDRLVVCHGDPCAPNTLIGDGGSWSGHVDMGSLGVADRWADLAVAGLNTVANYGPGWEDALLDAYGIDPDPVRIDYYRRLWNAT